MAYNSGGMCVFIEAKTSMYWIVKLKMPHQLSVAITSVYWIVEMERTSATVMQRASTVKTGMCWVVLRLPWVGKTFSGSA